MAKQLIAFEEGPWGGETTEIHKREEGIDRLERTDPHFTDEQHIGVASYERTERVETRPVEIVLRGGTRTQDKEHVIYRYTGTVIRDRESLLVLGEEEATC